MITGKLLYELMKSQSFGFTFVTGQDWAHFRTTIRDDRIVLWIEDIQYKEAYYLPLETPEGQHIEPLLDSPLYKENDISKYYIHMANRLIKFLNGLYSPSEWLIFGIDIFIYCKYCGRRLRNYNNMLRGYGEECKKYRRCK